MPVREDSFSMQKRTVTIRFELTKYQVNQLRALGRSLWPAINLPCDELCRRMLLDGADRRMIRSDGERLLEAGCQPEARTGPSAIRNFES